MEFIDACLDICLIILIVSIIILVGVEIVLLIIRAIIAYKEDKEEIIEKKKKESYLVCLTYNNELILNGKSMKKLIYIKAISPEEALKQAEEYFLNYYLSPALRASYKKGEYVTITKSIENCISIN